LIRIAQVIGKAILGGVDSILMNYYRNIDRSKFQFDFFVDGLGDNVYDEEVSNLGGRIYKLPPYEKNMRANLQTFRKILHENKYQIVHCNMNALSMFWLREAKLAGVPIRIAHNHSTAAFSEGKRAIIKYAFRPFAKIYPTNFAACGELAGKWLFGKNAMSKGQVFLINNAIDVNAFAYNSKVREKMRIKLGLENRFVIGHVGRFAHQKNHSFLLDTFKQVNNIYPQATLLLVGDGETRTEIERAAKDLPVLFLGNRRDMPDLYQAMDIFVLPSHFEGLPLSAVEAQAAGLPCILSEAVTQEVGLSQDVTFLPLNIQNWTDAILNAASDMKQTMEARRNSNLQIMETFDIKKVANRLSNFYEQLLKEVYDEEGSHSSGSLEI